MNSRERVFKAMKLQTPDRVPLMASPSWGFVLVQNSPIDPVDMWHNHMNLYPEAFCNISKRFHFDGVKIPGVGLAPLDREKVIAIDQGKAEGTVIYFKNGDSCTYCPDELPRYQYKAAPEIDINEFNPDSIPEELAYHPVSTRLRMNLRESPDGRVSEIIKAREIMGPEFSIHGQFYSPEDYLIDLLGLENAMLALHTHPDKCKEILIRYATSIGRHVQELIDCGVDAIKRIGDRAFIKGNKSEPHLGDIYLNVDKIYSLAHSQ